MITHTFETRLHWTGSTGVGWERYDRAHAVSAPIDVLEYEDAASATMPEGEGLAEIRLRPRIVLGPEASEERVRRLVGTAHEHCNVAQSLRTPIAVDPELELQR